MLTGLGGTHVHADTGDTAGVGTLDIVEAVPNHHNVCLLYTSEKDALYEKEDFSDEDGIKAAELEAEFAEMDGWEADSNASKMCIRDRCKPC